MFVCLCELLLLILDFLSSLYSRGDRYKSNRGIISIKLKGSALLLMWLCSLMNHLKTLEEMCNYRTVAAKTDFDSKK